MTVETKGTGVFYEKEKETMPPQTRLKYLQEQLRRIVSYAYEKAPAFRAKMDKAGLKTFPNQDDRGPGKDSDHLQSRTRFYAEG